MFKYILRAAFDDKIIPRLTAWQGHPDLAGLGIGYGQGAQEIKIPDFKSGSFAIGAQTLGGHFQITGAGDQRVIGLGAVIIQKPAFCHLIGCGELAVASHIKRGLIQHRHVCISHRGRVFRPSAGLHRVGGHAHICPDTPVDRQHTGFIRAAGFGIGVQEFIGGNIIDLTDGRCGGGA